MRAHSLVAALAPLLALTTTLTLTTLTLTACSGRDDGTIAADPDTKLHAGFPVVFAAPPPALEPGAPSPSNPLAMNAFKHDAPPPPAGAAVKSPAAPVDPCAVKDPKGPLAMPLRHDGPSDGPRRNPLCMRLK